MTGGYWNWNIGETAIKVDSSFLPMLGYQPDEVIITISSMVELTGLPDRNSFREKYQQHIASNGQIPVIQEIGFRHKNGTIVTLCITAKAHWNESQTPVCVIGTYINLTSRKKREKELWEENQFLYKTNCTGLVGGWELDLCLNTIIGNTITRQIFEVSPGFVAQPDDTWMFFKEGQDRNKIIQAFQKAVSKGKGFDLELKIITAKGNEIWTHIIGKVEYTNGKCAKLFGIIRDINEQKTRAEAVRLKHERLQQATDEKLEFLSFMSHEIRTPMNAIIGFTNLLLQDPRKNQIEYLNVLKFSADNLLLLINDILDFNKIDAGKIELETVEFNLPELLNNIRASHGQQAQQKGLQFDVSTNTDTPHFLIGDPARLGQVLINLLSNAIKFTMAGKVALLVTVLQQTNHCVTLRFEVSDTGIGIPEEKLESIFEKFTQVSSETSRKYGGTGLGLAICKRLLELVGSTIRVKSTLHEGSQFWFELSFKKGTGKQIPYSQNSYSAGHDLEGKKILIAEDNPINIMLVKKFLQQWKCEYDVAENGKIALEKVIAKDFDLVLMDLQMPVMDGYEATVAIRNLAPGKYRDLPIIALTASVVGDIQEKILEIGMNNFVIKPFKPSDLYNMLTFYLHPVFNE